MLDAKEIDNIRIRDCFIDIVSDAAPHFFKDLRHQRGWSAKGDLGTQFGQRPNVRTRDPAVKNISENGDIQPLKGAPFLTYREDVQQSLGGMFMSPIAGIDNAAFEKAREKVRGACGA